MLDFASLFTTPKPAPKWGGGLAKPQGGTPAVVRVGPSTTTAERRAERAARARRTRIGQPVRQRGRGLGPAQQQTGHRYPFGSPNLKFHHARTRSQTDPTVRENMRRIRAHQPTIVRVNR